MVHKLNLGCGRDYRPEWDNWDVSKNCKADRYIDISTEEWPVKDNYYDQIYCSGVLEQLRENHQLLHVMNECWRVLKNNGSLTIIVPSARYSNAFKDPHDVRHFTSETFDYFWHEKNEYKLYGHVYGYKPWNITSRFLNKNGILTIEMQKHVA